MKKDFITVTPDSGNLGTEVQVTVDPNIDLKSRSSSLNFASNKGNSLSVNVNQLGVPWFCTIGMATYHFFDNGETHWEANFIEVPRNILPIINSDGNFTQRLQFSRQRFPIGNSQLDSMTEQYLSFSLIVLDSITDIVKPIVRVANEGNEIIKLTQISLGNGYSQFLPENEKDPLLFVRFVGSSFGKLIKISFDDDDNYQLTYDIR
ncbi:BACON domain-containing carbohydrate-binding protein [Phocaeicola sartorii]|uniref:BACON domain-containing protein n=1 Tax=Phocaeicola sartorii TaxID=671267 RepID=UPI00258442B3|nr:BACON domain-containing carbohydrate-binding protein [Phocaeicola sartorii]